MPVTTCHLIPSFPSLPSSCSSSFSFSSKTPQILRFSPPKACSATHQLAGTGSILKKLTDLRTRISTPKFEPEDYPRLNFLQKLATSAIDTIEEYVVVPLEKNRPIPVTANPAIQLAGNFAPVAEMPVWRLHVDGQLPPSLDGVYVRNGANPWIEPTRGHHLFDDDGMLHAVSIRDGTVTYCCRYTRTERLVTEQRVGRTLYPKPIGQLQGHAGMARLLLHGARGLCGLVDANGGMGPANAGVVFFDDQLLAMSEDDMPYAIRVTRAGDLQTVGRFDFDGQVPELRSLIAHPVVDPVTGDMFALSYDVVRKPHLRLCRFSPAGGRLVGRLVDIRMPAPAMIHDFAVTETYVVIPDQQVVFDLKSLLVGSSPVVRDSSKPSRFGVMPRYDPDDRRIRWIEVPDCFCFHLWNAREGKNDRGIASEPTVIGSCMTPAGAMFNLNEGGVEQNLRITLSEIKLNLHTGTSTRREIIRGVNLEAGSINKRYVGRKSRYAYMAVAEPWPRVSGMVKVDLFEGRIVARHDYPQGCFGGEALFVARRERADEEDDGYVVGFMHDEGAGVSYFVVLDASRDGGLKKVASVRLPGRVPYGFHATFVPREFLLCQRS